MFAVAPMLELEHASGPVTAAVTASADGSQRSLAAHDSATCPACLVLHTHAWRSDADGVAFKTTGTHQQIVAHVNVAARSAPRQGFQSRAPPRAFA